MAYPTNLAVGDLVDSNRRRITQVINSALGAYITEKIVEPSGTNSIKWDLTKTYSLFDRVTDGTVLYFSNESNNLNNNPTVDTGRWWSQVGAEYSDLYSVAQDQFSGYQGGWEDYTKLPLAGNELLRMFDAGTFDFNDDGSPITFAADDIIQYQVDTWVKLSAPIQSIDSGAINFAPLFRSDDTNVAGYNAVTMPKALQFGDLITYEFRYGNNQNEGGSAMAIARDGFQQRYIPYGSVDRIKLRWLSEDPRKVFFAAGTSNTTLRIRRVIARRI